ncbi:MAG: thiosulfate oxidation carrier protein SoxY [Gammaproteobacteria bacterium]|nr:thiosulfate oxidation carrier protein SoxY [Gammaproteobacteria bacterium]
MKQSANTQLSRRHWLVLAGGTLLLGGAWRSAVAGGDALQSKIDAVLNGRSIAEGRIKLNLPEIAENGNTVPLKFEVDSPMTDADYVKSVHIYADGNPLPDVGSFHFSPSAGRAAASTRMRLAKTQNVVAVAEMSDGSVYTAKQAVKVTIGGCGG